MLGEDPVKTRREPGEKKEKEEKSKEQREARGRPSEGGKEQRMETLGLACSVDSSWQSPLL